MESFLDRTLPILGKEGMEALSTPLIAFAGLGGVGGGAFLNLVRCGVKRFRLAENGVFDPPDMNRQAAAFASTMGRAKIEVYERLAARSTRMSNWSCFRRESWRAIWSGFLMAAMSMRV
jgi:tRNA A37 threonylcarbamoyladenosine dehydratase